MHIPLNYNLNFKMSTNVIILFLLAIISMNCSGPSQNKQNEADAQKPAGLLPSSTPAKTVENLYGDSLFFHLRNTIPAKTIEYLSPCMTNDLKNHIEKLNKDIAAWMKNNKDSNLKLPISEGPIFLSNYEGANAYQVGEAMINGSVARVPVSLSVTDVRGTFTWADTAILKQEGSVWLLDNIIFPSEENDKYTLTDRLSLIQ
jgi:hypothetical protein